MKRLQTINIFTFLFLLCSGFLSAQIPSGGISLISEATNNYQKIAKGTLTPISIQDQSFTTGIRFETGTDVSSSWDAHIKFTGASGIAANDVVLVAFYARTISSLQESGEGALTVCIENSSSYAKEIYYKISIGREWKQYFASVKCASTLAVSAVTYSFHCGYPSQTIEVADVKFLNYKNTLALADLPQTKVSYIGQDANASWRASADDRINQIRKGKVDFKVYDESGKVLKDASVTIEMTKHQFGFGSAVAASKFISDATYRKKIYELFNEVVLENDLKWPSFNPNPTLNTTRTLDSLINHGIAVRGHNLIWPSFNYNLASLKTLSSDPVAFRNEIDRHIDQVTKYTLGKVIDWDVLNEPYTNTEFQKILGDEVMADWFKRARQNDREVKLYINDYSILTGGGNDTKHQDGYFNIIKYIDGLGGRIEGIGMQGHFGSDLTSITKVYSILDRFAALGKEIKITEHDINITQRDVQAEYTRDFMTIVFSHPAVKSFLFWGFWANQHWLPDGAMFDSNWTIRPNGEAYKDLVFNQWWTKATSNTTDSTGQVSFEGFLGTYKYTLKSGNKERTGTFKIENSNQSGIGNQVVLSLDSAIPDNFSITKNKPACLCEGENILLSAPAIPDFTYNWFRGNEILPEKTASIVADQPGLYSVKISKGAIELNSDTIEVKVNKLPEAILSTTGDLSFCPGGKVSFSSNVSNDLSYSWYKGSTKIQGSVTTLDIRESGTYSLVTNAYGCSATSEPVSVLVYSATDPKCTTGINSLKNTVLVYPNPFQGSFTVEPVTSGNAPVFLELFNALGVPVYQQQFNRGSGKTTISVSNSGFYTLKLSSENEVQTYKLVGY